MPMLTRKQVDQLEKNIRKQCGMHYNPDGGAYTGRAVEVSLAMQLIIRASRYQSDKNQLNAISAALHMLGVGD